jgi:SHS2 domain-containing protein
MRRTFEIIDHTADIGLRVYGMGLEEIFVNAASGLFSLITDLKEITPVVSRQVSVTAADSEELLIRWLNELIYIFETGHLVFSCFDIEELNQQSLKASCRGQKIDRNTRICREIKAATYHMLSIRHLDTGLEANIIFDV